MNPKQIMCMPEHSGLDVKAYEMVDTASTSAIPCHMTRNYGERPQPDNATRVRLNAFFRAMDRMLRSFFLGGGFCAWCKPETPNSVAMDILQLKSYQDAPRQSSSPETLKVVGATLQEGVS